eukprot:CAMPEP_0119005584 /NCGR_PEP_ID=MMETSP1176-20130426/1811_1 /TAXON_ID=265551 /ORGANISM="Synedropsis recta cf, Strain CCMP1620" /LENGTH=119 /DNA_ID=CAMNT_0006957415 /DNA_START=76 /DNA_END=432 /DNA_ORIENTATION=-
MSSMSFSSGKQYVKPPQRGIFPLDHESECKAAMQSYLGCLKESRDMHHKCRDLSKDYLQCRMDKQLMAEENLNDMGFSEEQKVIGAKEYDKSKEKAGYIAGKHIDKPNQWFWEKKKRDW